MVPNCLNKKCNLTAMFTKIGRSTSHADINLDKTTFSKK